MKKLILMFTVALLAATSQMSSAQVSLHINIGSQPNWGPRGYDYVEYYYLPEIGVYYHVPTKRYVYLERNKWVHRRGLPKVYRNYNLYSGRKIVINEPRPYLSRGTYNTRYVERYRHDNGRHKGWEKNGRDHGRPRH